MKNERPGGILGDWKFGWDGTTLSERIQAQNVWDLGKAQEEANEIARQQLELDKQKYIEQQENNKIDLEYTRKQVTESLCNQIGINGKDFLTYVDLLKQQSNSTNIKYEISKLEKFLDDSKNTRLVNKILIYFIMLICIPILVPVLSIWFDIDNSSMPIYITSFVIVTILLTNIYCYLKDKIQMNKLNYYSKQDIKNKIQQLQQQKEDKENEPYNKFYSFRVTHYNKDFENILRKVNLWRLTPILKQESIKEGTIYDYNKYFEENI